MANIRKDPGTVQWVGLKEQRWGKTDAKNRDHKLGFIYFGCDFLFLKPSVGQHEAGGLQWHFYVTTELLQQEEIYFGIILQSKVNWHTQLPACLPQETLLGQGMELEGTKFVHIHTGWATWLKIIRVAGTISFLSSENSFYLAPFQFLACQVIILTIYPPPWSPCV